MRTDRMAVVLPGLAPEHRDRIRSAAEKRGFEVRFFESPAESLPFLAEAEIVFGHDPVLAKNAPKLKWLCSPFAGVDAFTVPDAFASPDAVLTNSSGAYGVTIAEHVIGMLLALLRRRPDYEALLARRQWVRDLPVRSIKGSRLLLAGTGDIGRTLASRLRAFEPAEIIGVNRSGRCPSGFFDRVCPVGCLEDLLPGADALILSLPGTPETRHLMDASRLSLLPDQAVIINVGRGSAIDSSALEKELRSGRLLAALDVFEKEPLPPEDSLWTCPNLIISSHTAGNMTLPWTVSRIVDLFLEDLENYCAGRPLLRRVDPEKGY